MPDLGTITITPTGGTAVTVLPSGGALGAEGIFFPREEVESFFPIVQYDEEYADSIDTEGALRVRSRPENSTGAGSVFVSGSSEATFSAYLDRWQATVEAMRKDGGTITYSRPGSGTTVTYDVLSMRTTAAPYDGIMLRGWIQAFGFEFTCKPYARLSQVDATIADVDPFARDTLTAGEWGPFDVGSGTLSVSGGQLVPSSTAEKRFYRYGLTVADGVEVVKVTTGASVAGGLAEAIGKRIDANNWLSGGVSFSGSSSTLVIRKDDASTVSALATSPTFTTAPNTTYYVRFQTANNVVAVSLHATDPTGAAEPATSSPAIASVLHTLTAGNSTKYGDGVWGGVGLRVTPQATDWRYDEWRVEALALRSTEPLFAFEVPRVPGHVDALADLTLTDVSGQSRQHVEVGLESGSEYDPAVNPPNIIDSDQLVTAGLGGAQNTRSGAFDPLASGNSVVRMTLSNAPLAVCSTGDQSHVGTYKVKARVWGAGIEALKGGPVYIRLAWRDGSGPWARNKWATVPALGAFTEVDLDYVTLTKAPSGGTQKWEGRIEAYSANPGDTIDVDYIEVLGASRLAKSRAASADPTAAPAALSAADEFAQTAGNLDAPKAPRIPSGGSWGVANRTAANGYQVTGSGSLVRTAGSDGGITTPYSSGSFAFVGPSLSALAVQADCSFSGLGGLNVFWYGIIARYTNTSNYVLLALNPTQSAGLSKLVLYACSGGVATLIDQSTSTLWSGANLVYRLGLALTPSGEYTISINGVPILRGASPLLGTSSVPAGQSGLYNYNSSTGSTTTYDNFLTWAPEQDYAIYASRHTRFRESDVIRQDPGGTIYGPAPAPTGARLRLPPAGRASRVSRLAVKARRNDVDRSFDDQISDGLQTSLKLTPRVALLG